MIIDNWLKHDINHDHLKSHKIKRVCQISRIVTCMAGSISMPDNVSRILITNANKFGYSAFSMNQINNMNSVYAERT